MDGKGAGYHEICPQGSVRNSINTQPQRKKKKEGKKRKRKKRGKKGKKIKRDLKS